MHQESAHTYVHIYIYIYIYTCTFICIYIYTHTCVHSISLRSYSLIHSCDYSLLIRMFIHWFSVWVCSLILLWDWSTLIIFEVNRIVVSFPWSHWQKSLDEPWPGENHSKERLVHQRLCVEAQLFEDEDSSCSWKISLPEATPHRQGDEFQNSGDVFVVFVVFWQFFVSNMFDLPIFFLGKPGCFMLFPMAKPPIFFMAPPSSRSLKRSSFWRRKSTVLSQFWAHNWVCLNHY